MIIVIVSIGVRIYCLLLIVGKKDGELMSKEEREIGSVSFRVYLRYFGSYGLPLLLLVVCTAVVIETLQAGTDFWLSNWSTANSSDPTEVFLLISSTDLY